MQSNSFSKNFEFRAQKTSRSQIQLIHAIIAIFATFLGNLSIVFGGNVSYYIYKRICVPDERIPGKWTLENKI